MERGKSEIVFKLNITTLCTTHIVRVCNSKCVHLQKNATIIQVRKLLIIKRFLPRKLFKGGNYSRAETIRGNTVHGIFSCERARSRVLPHTQVCFLLESKNISPKIELQPTR